MTATLKLHTNEGPSELYLAVDGAFSVSAQPHYTAPESTGSSPLLPDSSGPQTPSGKTIWTAFSGQGPLSRL